MATIEQLSRALVNADAAGDVAAAKTLANEIIRLRGESAPGAESQQSKDLRSELSDMSNKMGGATIDSLAQVRFDKLPTWKKPLVATADLADQFANGVTFGLGNKAAAAARSAFTDKTYAEELAAMEDYTNKARERSGSAGLAAEIGGSFVLPTGLVKAGLSPTARAINAGGGLGRVSLASAAEGAGFGALQGAGSSDGSLSGMTEGAKYGAVGGAAIGGALPLAMKAVTAAGRKVISPFTSSPERQAAVSSLSREGVETTAGQRLGNDRLRYAEAELGGRKVADKIERQGEQFTSAILKRAGINANRATPDVIDDGFRAIGQKFDNLASRNNLAPDTKLAQDLGAVWREYASLVPESRRAPVVMDLIQDLGKTLGQGSLDGSAYQAVRSRLDRMARGAVSDPQLQDALYGLRNALDDGMERSLYRTNPRDLGEWRKVRNQYRNMLVIEKAATGAGENAASGIISPAQLRNATVTKHGRRNYARGKGDFAELARSGEAVLRSMPNSGTAGRLNAQNLGANVGALLGLGGAGYASGGDPKTMLAGAAAGFAAPRMAGALLMSKPVQTYLSNQLARGGGLTAQTRGLLAAIANAESSQIAPDTGKLLLGR
ncbi:hypothetical protein [Shinella fusca]|uniref:Uncharacterized protein n=1 Tax=Shinella fusca TaxID=544480 RepID=A0A7W7YR40_9HYPH|nr:hypothetical protein [Shinella fusca]MBB5040801.1 hypothetical protein [Shinella fusca]